MHFSTALIFTSITTVLAAHGDATGPGSGMAMSAASSWISGYSLSASSMYPITGLTATTKVKGKDDMTTTSVGTYSMVRESGDKSKGNSTMVAASTTSTKASSVISGSTTAAVALSTKASLTATTTGTAAAQATTNAAAAKGWSAAAGLAAIAGLVMA